MVSAFPVGSCVADAGSPTRCAPQATRLAAPRLLAVQRDLGKLAACPERCMPLGVFPSAPATQRRSSATFLSPTLFPTLFTHARAIALRLAWRLAKGRSRLALLGRPWACPKRDLDDRVTLTLSVRGRPRSCGLHHYLTEMMSRY